jgi:hypothetical protein
MPRDEEAPVAAGAPITSNGIGQEYAVVNEHYKIQETLQCL